MLKVVARLRDGKLLKGYLLAPGAEDVEEFLHEQPSTVYRELTIRLVTSSDTISVPVEALKAVFFVKTFEGRKDYEEVKFFTKSPPIRGLWVRVEFSDRERLEGVVENSLRFLVEPGFFMKPPDPQSNNDILYVVKESLRDFRVLGVRSDY